jgi:hypothetical protein
MAVYTVKLDHQPRQLQADLRLIIRLTTRLTTSRDNYRLTSG